MPGTLAERSPADHAWSAFGSGSARHLMLDPDHCIRCGDCETSCPWESVYVLSDEDSRGAGSAEAVFLVEDHTCTRCGLCIEVCPTDCLYFARLGEEEDPGETRTLGVVLHEGAQG
jgi:NAD-dependent dihydropyrimidine dehydrogenase PreA subunit